MVTRLKLADWARHWLLLGGFNLQLGDQAQVPVCTKQTTGLWPQAELTHVSAGANAGNFNTFHLWRAHVAEISLFFGETSGGFTTLTLS